MQEYMHSNGCPQGKQPFHKKVLHTHRGSDWTIRDQRLWLGPSTVHGFVSSVSCKIYVQGVLVMQVGRICKGTD